MSTIVTFSLLQAEAGGLEYRRYSALLVEADLQPEQPVRLKKIRGLRSDVSVRRKPIRAAIQGSERIEISDFRFQRRDNVTPYIGWI